MTTVKDRIMFSEIKNVKVLISSFHSCDRNDVACYVFMLLVPEVELLVIITCLCECPDCFIIVYKFVVRLLQNEQNLIQA